MIWDEQNGCELVSSVNEGFFAKLAVAVQEARGKLSQREFAEVLGVSQSTVQQWENGKNVPSGLSDFYLWVKTLETDAGICGCELPIYRLL